MRRVLTLTDPRRLPTGGSNLREDISRGSYPVTNMNTGLCTSLNYFLYELLRAVGFNASLVAGTVEKAPDITHALVVVRDLVDAGDVYLADIATGYPTHRAVPLDFSKESPVYHDSFQV